MAASREEVFERVKEVLSEQLGVDDAEINEEASFQEDLDAGGHTLVAVSPLEPSAKATSMRPDGGGSALVTDGPFSETAEQVVGFYLVETDDEAGLRDACERFASRGEHLELRRLAD